MSKFYTDKRWKCVDCGSENITFQVFIININYKEVEIDWDHDNIGNCLECLTEVGIEEVK